MDNFNKIVSFVLGLVVVIVFLAVITGRLNLKNRFRGIAGGTKPSPTPTLTTKPDLSPTQLAVAINPTKMPSYQSGTRAPTSIPATGSPTLLLPLLFSSLSLGVYLKRKK